MAEKKVIDDETSDKTKIKMNKINQIGIFFQYKTHGHSVFLKIYEFPWYFHGTQTFSVIFDKIWHFMPVYFFAVLEVNLN